MKGGFVYQDTGKADKALATFSTNLLMGVADLKVGAPSPSPSQSPLAGCGCLWQIHYRTNGGAADRIRAQRI